MGRHAATVGVAGGITVPAPANRNEVRIKHLRAKFAVAPHQRPPSVAESDWGIFTACVHDKRALTAVSRSLGLPPSDLRDALARVEIQIEPPGVKSDEALEALDLSVRAKNALHRLGCETVADVLRLDFNVSIRQLGSKTRSEVLDQLDKAGFHLALPDKPLPSEMRRIARGLDRVQTRINSAYQSVMREIRLLQERLEKLGE